MGTGELGLALPGGVTAAAAARRTRYLSTLSSADTLLMVNTVELRLDRAAAPGWAGEVVFRRETFPDNNHTTSAYAWILAPVLSGGRPADNRRPGASLRLGYAFSWSDADANRWSAVLTGEEAQDSLPGSTIPGRYQPYFTPNDQQVHSLLAEVAATFGGGTTLRLSGTLGILATENAPVLIATGPGESQLFFYERDYTPWRITAGATVPLSRALTLTADAEAWRTSYYEMRQFGVGMVYRFGRTDLP
jgi:hypothetical protein